jgi:hypothetical protein
MIEQAVLILFAAWVGGFAFWAALKPLQRTIIEMSNDLIAAVDNLKKEVGETVSAVSAKLAEIAANTSDTAAVDAINEQSRKLDELQNTLLAPSAPAGDPPADDPPAQEDPAPAEA